jgi:integrase/recombinase XerD
MSRSKSESLLGLTESFFHNYLQQTRGASGHTVRAYRDALKLFYLFLADRKRKPVADLSLDDIQSDALLAFLDHVESRRGNSAVTRNCRLAAVRSFVQHLLRHDVTRAGQYGRILAIRNKKALRRAATYLEPEQASAVIAAIDRRSRNGERDHALLLFLYNTGARVSEALAIRTCDLQLDRPRQVRLLGKGRKERICPLWPETASALHRIIRAKSGEDFLFRNTRGAPLTRDGVAYLLRKYVRSAAQHAPALRKRRVTPHVMRHSCAVALLQAGNRCVGDPRLSRSCIGGHHKPIHYDQSSDEARRAGGLLEASRSRPCGPAKVAAIAKATRIPRKFVTPYLE